MCEIIAADDEVARPRRALDAVVLLQTTRPRPSVMNGGSLSCTAVSVWASTSAWTAELADASAAAGVAVEGASSLGRTSAKPRMKSAKLTT